MRDPVYLSLHGIQFTDWMTTTQHHLQLLTFSSNEAERITKFFTSSENWISFGYRDIDKTKKEDWLRFNALDPSASGRGAEPIYRDPKTGDRMSGGVSQASEGRIEER